MHSWRSSLIQRGENGLNWKYDIRFLFHAYILFCGPLCYKEPWATLSPSVQCVITFDMCLSWLKAVSLSQTPEQVYQDGSIQVHPVSGYSPAYILLPGIGPAHPKLGYTSLCRQRCPNCRARAPFYVNSHQPHPFQPCLTWKYLV